MEYSEEIDGILDIECLMIASQNSDQVESPSYSPLTPTMEEFEIVMAEMLPQSNNSITHNTPVDYETPDLLPECECIIMNSESDTVKITEIKSDTSYENNFNDKEISATSSQFSESEKERQSLEQNLPSPLEPAENKGPSNLRRSNRIRKSNDFQNSANLSSKHKSLSPSAKTTIKSNRKRKSDGVENDRPQKIQRTQSFTQTVKSPKISQSKSVSNSQKSSEQKRKFTETGSRRRKTLIKKK